MSDPAERFIAAVVAPFADNAEMEVAARRLLEGALAESGAEVPEQAVEHLVKASGRRGLWRHWQLVLIVVAALAAVTVAIGGIRSWRSLRANSSMMGGIAGRVTRTPPPGYVFEEAISRGRSAQERLLMVGDYSQASETKRWKALWDSEPGNAMYYIEYASAHIAEHKSLPPDFLETGRRIDPGNGWFPAIAAGLLSEQAVQANKRTDAEKRAKVPATYTVKDGDKLREAREQFREAARMPEFDTRQHELFAQRIRLLPRRTGAFDQAVSLAYVAGFHSATLRVRAMASLIQVECVRLTGTGDRAELSELIADWDRFVPVYTRSRDVSMIDGLVKLVVMRTGYRELAQAAAKLDLAADATRLQAVADRFEDYQKQKEGAKDRREDYSREAATFADLSLPVAEKQTLHPPEVRTRLKPGRLAEHEFLAKVLAVLLLGPALLIGGLCVGFYRFRGGDLRRVLSARLTDLLGGVDWAWVLGAGVMLPFAAYQVLSRMPWIGGREWSISASRYMVPAGPITLLGWLMLMLPVVIARWRLSKRGGFAGLHWRRARVAGGIAVLLALALPFAPQVLLPWRIPPWGSGAIVILYSLPPLWVLTVACRGLFSGSEHLLRRITLSRAVLPAYSLGLLLTALAVPFHHALEKHWAGLDELTEITPEAPSLNRYEYEATQVLRQEILDNITPAP